MPALSIRGACPHWAIRGACPQWAIRGACPHWAVRGVRCATLRSALIPNIRNSRSLLIDRRAGVLFPTALAQSAGYKASLRVQSERSERLRELTPAARRRGRYFIDRCAGILFPAALVTIAAYKAALRVQSEQSGGVPPLSIRAGRSTSFRSALEPNIHYSRSILK